MWFFKSHPIEVYNNGVTLVAESLHFFSVESVRRAPLPTRSGFLEEDVCGGP